MMDPFTLRTPQDKVPKSSAVAGVRHGTWHGTHKVGTHSTAGTMTYGKLVLVHLTLVFGKAGVVRSGEVTIPVETQQECQCSSHVHMTGRRTCQHTTLPHISRDSRARIRLYPRVLPLMHIHSSLCRTPVIAKPATQNGDKSSVGHARQGCTTSYICNKHTNTTRRPLCLHW
jgi:hypothetical protein